MSDSGDPAKAEPTSFGVNQESNIRKDGLTLPDMGRCGERIRSAVWDITQLPLRYPVVRLSVELDTGV